MNQNNTLKQSSKVALAVMIVLLIGAFLFYKERALFLDNAYIDFRIINLRQLQIQEHRYGSFITQIVPYIGAMLHWSLRTIMIAYSASFNLFYCLVIILLIYRYKAYGLAILYAFYNTLFISDAYFWTNNEVHQGTAWLFIFFAVIFYYNEKHSGPLLLSVLFILFGSLAIFTHPLIMISAFYLWIFFILDKESWAFNLKKTLLFTLLLSLIVAVKFYVSNRSGYDGGVMHNVTHTTLPSILKAFRTQLAKSFFYDCINNYWWTTVIFILSVVTLIFKKKYAQLLWLLLSALGFFILMALAYGDDPYNRHVLFYMESEWATLSIIIAAPFVFYLLPLMKVRWAILFLIAVFFTRILYICAAIPLFRDRMEFLDQALMGMRERNLTKAIIVKNSQLEDKLLMDWGLPVETMMLSKLEGDNPQLTIAPIAASDLATKIPADNRQMIDCFGTLTFPLKQAYFSYDTTRPYTILHYEDLFKNSK